MNDDLVTRLLNVLHQPSKQAETDVTVRTLADVRPSVSTTSKRPQPSRNRSTPYFGFQTFFL